MPVGFLSAHAVPVNVWVFLLGTSASHLSTSSSSHSAIVSVCFVIFQGSDADSSSTGKSLPCF